MKVKLTKPAERRLDQITDYHKRKGNKNKGKELRKKIVEISKLLSKNPKMGREEDYLKGLGQGHRYVLLDKFHKLIYRIIKPFIYITDVFDTRQNPDKMKP